VGLILFAIITTALYSVWNHFWRYRAFGTITGQTIQVSPPWDGAVRYLHVRAGDTIRQGQILISLDNTQLRQRGRQLEDETRLAQASLEAEVVRLKWQWAFNLDESRGAVTHYYEALGNYLREEGRLSELTTELQRSELLIGSGAISQAELDRIRFARQGQAGLVAKLREFLPDLKRRAEQVEAVAHRRGETAQGLTETGSDLLKPFFVKVEALQAERARLQEQLDQGQVRAPTGGTILKIERTVGEHCKIGQPLLNLLEEGSLRVVLYLPQQASNLLEVGQEVPLVLDPYPEPFVCVVGRLGDRFESAPEQLKRHFDEGQKLLPVELQPKEEMTRWMALRVGGVVKLPIVKPATWGWASP
jgi:multidrug resistance efflux pump